VKDQPGIAAMLTKRKDACFNAFLGVMANANEMLGFLHGFYGVGATIAPLIATTMITKANLPWHTWYYVLVCALLYTAYHRPLTKIIE
jgi:fucose permease